MRGTPLHMRCLVVGIFVAASAGIACGQECSDALSPLTTSRLHRGFVPGDAFFAVEIEDSLSIGIESWPLDEEQTSLTLHYLYPDVAYVPSQQEYLGFSRLTINGLAGVDNDNINKFHELISSEQRTLDMDRGKEPWWGDKEDKPMIAMVVVNKEFPWRNFRFFVRYNESWNRETPTYWPGKESLLRNGLLWSPLYYQPHIASPDAVLEDWVHGSDVEPLKVRLPDEVTYEKQAGRREVIEAVEVAFDQVAIIGFPTSCLSGIFANRLNSAFFVVTTDGVKRCRWVLSRETAEKVTVEELMFNARDEGEE